MFGSLEEWVEEKWISLYLTRRNIFKLYQMKSKQDTWSSEGIQSPEEVLLPPHSWTPFMYYICSLKQYFPKCIALTTYVDHLGMFINSEVPGLYLGPNELQSWEGAGGKIWILNKLPKWVSCSLEFENYPFRVAYKSNFGILNCMINAVRGIRYLMEPCSGSFCKRKSPFKMQITRNLCL